MKRSHLVWLSSAVAIAGAFLVYEVAVQSRAVGPAPVSTASAAPAATPAASTADLARMNAQLAALRAQVAGLEKERGEAGGEPGATPAADPARRTLTDDEQRAEDDRVRAEHMAGVEADFRRDTVDPAWSAKTTERIRSTIAGTDALRGAIRDVECRSRMCRVEIADDGTGALSKHLLMFAHQVGDVLPRMAARPVDKAGGGTSTELYFMGPEPTPALAPKN